MFSFSLLTNALLWLSLLLIFSCKEDYTSRDAGSPETDSLVLNFYNEAKRHGVTIDVQMPDLVVRFGDLDRHSGSCKPNTKPRVITLDSLVWRLSSHRVREMLLFHELSHCLLGLHHDNRSLTAGECVSWMRESNAICNINYINPAWRDYYLEQLFCTATFSKPSWYEFNGKTSLGGQFVSSCYMNKNQEVFPEIASLNDKDSWMIKMTMPVTEFPASAIFQVNEYWFSLEWYQLGTEIVQDHTIIVNQFSSRDSNLFSRERTVEKGSGHEWIIKKETHLILLFFDGVQKLCIPTPDDAFMLKAFTSFENCRIDIFSIP